jgi:hypothetical protein
VAINIPNTRVTCREGVNAAQAFFEKSNCIFQVVAHQNDFGKDAYIDLARHGSVTSLCVAVQIKSGESYRTTQGDYFIPVEQHAENWRHSTVPVFGVIYDPGDQILRWVDLTAYLRMHPQQNAATVPVLREAILNEETLRQDFERAVLAYAVGGEALALNLLSPGDSQPDAVSDAWALGRYDYRYLLLLRRLILELRGPALRTAIAGLSHGTPHPDIYWTKDNWIPPDIIRQVRPSFRWSLEEIAHMLQVIEPEEWGRGTLGQCVDMLISEDPEAIAKLKKVVRLLVERSTESATISAAMLALTHSLNPRDDLRLIVQEYPELLRSDWFREMAATTEEFGSLSLY